MGFCLEKRKTKTIELDIHTFHLWKQCRVHVGLVQVHGLCGCDLLPWAVMASWLPPAIDFLSILKDLFVFFVSAQGWSYLLLGFVAEDCQVRRSDKRLFKNELPVQFEIILSTGPLRSSSQMGLRFKHTNAISSPGKLKSAKNYFDLKRFFFADVSSWLILTLCKKKLKGTFQI